MASNQKNSEAAILEKYRVAFANAEDMPQIATAIAEYGYDAETMAQGKALHTAAQNAYDLNKTEDAESLVAHNIFEEKRSVVAKIYAEHRKKAKAAFRNDANTSIELAITGTLSNVYVKWLETVKRFYLVALASTDIQTKLNRFKITVEDLTAVNAKIVELETARNNYMREKGESQDATKAKNAALILIDDWMSEFYEVAKIALEDQPQLLEALGVIVRS